MIVLDSTPWKLQVLLDGAAATTELPLVASYVDWTASGPTYTPTPVGGITTGATAVDLVPAPSAGTTRTLKFLSALNVDTAVRVVTIRLNNSGTTRKVITATLAVGDSLQFIDSAGWRVLDSTGAVKTAAIRSTNDRMRSLSIGVDGGATVLTTGTKSARVMVPYNGQIQKVTVLGIGGTGSVVVDIWKDSYANYPANVADTITASAKPTISSATKSQDATLTGWNKTVTAGDHFILNIDSVSTFTAIAVILDILTD